MTERSTKHASLQKLVNKLDSGTSLIWTPLGQKKVSSLVRCPDFRGCNVHKQRVRDSQMVLFFKVHVSSFQVS